ncbi:CcdC protein domain-containing protein [Bacillus atrophaeus]|uniref:CcdC protein domain-containing protein n=1 Tax=Bacillus atrophaeus TaxID=1452 RepID=UPI0039907C25
MSLYIFIIIILIFGLIVWRQSVATRNPIKGSGIRILLPVIYMLSGFSMLLNPYLQLTRLELLIAICLGVIFSIPMILTTNFEIRHHKNIYTKPNKAFFLSLFVLLVIRLLLSLYIKGIPTYSLSFLFFLVAFTYLLIWRFATFIKYRMLLNQVNSESFISNE